MADVPKRFADNRDDWSFVEREFSRGLNMQGKSGSRPTENGCAYFTPLRFCRYFDNHSIGLVAGRILQRQM